MTKSLQANLYNFSPPDLD